MEDGSTWNIGGSLGPVTVTGQVVWSLDGGQAGPLGNIQSLHLGAVQDSFVTAAGAIGSLTAAGWDGGAVQAAPSALLTWPAIGVPT